MSDINILAFSDTHLTNTNSKFRKNTDGVSDLLISQYEFFKWVADELRTGDYDAWAFLGDLPDKNIFDAVTLTYINKSLKALFDTGVPGWLLGGNHAVSDKKNSFTVMGAVEDLINQDHIHFFHNTGLDDSLDGVAMYFQPYISDYKQIERNIRSWNEMIEDDSGYHVLLGHFPTVNAMLDNGFPSESGVDLTQEMIDNFDICLLGDFHKPQKITNTSNAYYVGAPFDLKYGQEGERQVTKLVLTESGYKLYKLDNPYNYQMLKLSPEEFLKLDEEALDRAIVKLTSAPTSKQRVKIESLKGKVYSLYIPKIKIDKRKKKDLDDYHVIEPFSSADDVKSIKEEIDKRKDLEEDIKKKSIEIFEEVSQ